MMGLLDDLQSEVFAQSFFAVAESVDGLVVGGLVPAEPFADAGDSARVHLVHVVNIVDLVREGIFSIDGNELPVEFAWAPDNCGKMGR